MRQLTFRRRPAPIVIGGGLVAVSVIAASCVAALTGGQDRGNTSAAATARGAANAAATTQGTANAASLAGGVPSTLSLPVPGSAHGVSSTANQGATDTSSHSRPPRAHPYRAWSSRTSSPPCRAA